jgi:glutamine---fructose-6-phosphate transaminase (isomerizing)
MQQHPACARERPEMTVPAGQMQKEIGEAADVVRRQAEVLRAPIAELARQLGRTPPQVVVTCARGSSAHAATFGKHLIERRFGIPVAAAAPNIATVYGRDLQLKGQLFLAVSQSGRSDDLVEQTRSAKRSGALTAALLNVTDSPLGQTADIVLPMAAGPELSVAATKTFVASLAGLLRLVGEWGDEDVLRAALTNLPEALGRAGNQIEAQDLAPFADAANLVTIGRGPTLAIAREAALKLKETCNLHAEPFSGAEIMHGPIALVERDFPILMFMPGDEAEAGMRALAENLRRKGAALLMMENSAATGHPDSDAVCLAQSFYTMLLRLAQLRGSDVDRPRHLQKVTRTR